MAVADAVFVQPHFDDVALSCGGTVAAYAEAGRPKIVTLFGGEPFADASKFARFQHARWQLGDADVVAQRRLEDRRAAALLGETVEVVWLDHLDAIYRRSAYASDAALFGELVPSDLKLVDELADELEPLGTSFALPLAIGNHVDHQLAFRAGRALAGRGHEVWFYADMPYALDRAACERRLETLGRPAPCVRPLSPEQFARRWGAIECYASQLPVIFRDLTDPRGTFASFGGHVRGANPVELFWRLPESEG